MRIVIIGAGPGGYETAIEAVRRGHEVTLVSAGPLGGTCLNEGCIPTKTFISCDNLEEAQVRKAEVLETLRKGIASLLKGVRVIEGIASFVDARTVAVGEESIEADRIIIATGSVSSSLPIPGADKCLTSKEILELDKVPQNLCVIGGGVIGLEFASIFHKFGSEVTVLEYAPQLLPHFDTDIAKRLKSFLSRKGMTIKTGFQVNEVPVGEYDAVLMAVGRRANVDTLNLSQVGIEYSRKGIVTDDNFLTSVPGIYAVGDVNGKCMLAHAAKYQGLHALNHIDGIKDEIRFDLVPAAVFTSPELASVGFTEDKCKEEGIEYKVLKAMYGGCGKAVAMGESEGVCKLLVSSEDESIIGCHIIGAHASDLIHEAAVLIQFGIKLNLVRSVIHAHPTLSELFAAAVG